jgi:hypothetical protein
LKALGTNTGFLPLENLIVEDIHGELMQEIADRYQKKIEH